MLIRKTDIPDLTPADREEDIFAPSRKHSGNGRHFISGKGDEIQGLLGELKPNEAIHIATRGKWSSPHLIEEILKQIGPAECWVTSWSVKEQAVRILLNLLEQGQLTGLHCLFDERIRVNCPDAFKLAAQNLTNIKLTKIHAKVIVLMNDKWGVSVVTSANMTRNPRIECFVVFTEPSAAEFHRDWIQREITNGKPFE